jgi:hypothetical protein
MNGRAKRCVFGAAVLLMQLCGCSLYLIRPVTITVRDAETKQPIEGAEVSSDYMRMIDFGLIFAGGNYKEGVSDSDGKVTLVIDPYKDHLTLNAQAKGYHNQDLYSYGPDIRKRVVPRNWFEWRNEFVLEMYAEPKGTLNLVVPKGYRGAVVVRFAENDSPPVPPGQRIFTYAVPPNGVVDVKESGLLERAGSYHRVHARFEDGTELPTLAPTTDDPKSLTPCGRELIALRFIDPVWRYNTWVYFLGDHGDAIAFRNIFWPDRDSFDEAAFMRLCAGR